MSNIQKPNTQITNTVSFLQKGKKIKPLLKDIFLIKTYVAGLYYVDNLNDIFPLIKVNDKLELFREASNNYDKHAILVKYNGQKLGYVPRKDNYILSKLMDGGKQLYGVVERIGVDELYKGDETKFINFKIFLKEY